MILSHLLLLDFIHLTSSGYSSDSLFPLIGEIEFSRDSSLEFDGDDGQRGEAFIEADLTEVLPGDLGILLVDLLEQVSQRIGVEGSVGADEREGLVGRAFCHISAEAVLLVTQCSESMKSLSKPR